MEAVSLGKFKEAMEDTWQAHTYPIRTDCMHLDYHGGTFSQRLESVGQSAVPLRATSRFLQTLVNCNRSKIPGNSWAQKTPLEADRKSHR
jgi:hypothetical protein